MPAKLTQEEINKRVQQLNCRGIYLISDYIGVNSTHTFKCVLGHIWRNNFSNVARGSGCPECVSVEQGKKRRLSNDTVTEKIVELKNRNILFLGEYKGNIHKYTFVCLVCDHNWQSTWGTVVNGESGCPQCSGHYISPEIKAQRLKELEDRGITLVTSFTNGNKKHTFNCAKCKFNWRTTFNSVYHQKTGCPKCAGLFIDDNTRKKIKTDLELKGFELLEPYKNGNHKHEVKCIKCSYKWKNRVNRINYCPKCAGECIENRLVEVRQRNIILLDPFTKATARYNFCCLTCNFKWKTSWNDIYNGKKGCPKCAKNRVDDEIIETRLKELKQRNISVEGAYKSAKHKHNFICGKCDHTWVAAWYNVVNSKTGCPKCAGKVKTEEEKLISTAHDILRQRFNELIKTKKLKSKPYRDKDGKLNDFYYELFPYWAEQYKQFIAQNPKPKNGRWHLDHIIPCSWWNPYDMAQLKLCWHHKNLQWLTASENSAKCDRVRQKDVLLFDSWHWEALKHCSFPKHPVTKP